jgi:hypothetical protein
MRNQNFLKVGSGSVMKSFVSTTLTDTSYSKLQNCIGAFPIFVTGTGTRYNNERDVPYGTKESVQYLSCHCGISTTGSLMQEKFTITNSNDKIPNVFLVWHSYRYRHMQRNS